MEIELKIHFSHHCHRRLYYCFLPLFTVFSASNYNISTLKED